MAEKLTPDQIKRPDETLEQYVARVKPPTDVPPAQPVFDADLIPEVPKDTRFDKEREEIDAVLGRMDIVDAYNKYCGKMKPNVGSKRESILVSCPFPGHADKHPSAWLNLDKGNGGVGVCAMCGGFDKYDMAAWHFGFDVPGYKTGASYPELRRKMAEGLGYTVMTSGKAEWLEKSQPPAATPSAPVSDVKFEEQPVASSLVFPIPENDDLAGFDYRDLEIFQGATTFMSEWMDGLSKTTQPDEFYFSLGLMALGLVCRNKVILDDETPVRSNLNICLVGSTGTGKSRSASVLMNTMRDLFPYDVVTAGGVKLLDSVGSGESLVDQMTNHVTDPVTKVKTYLPVTGLYYEDEMEGFLARANRMGSTFRPTIMKFNDSPADVSTVSRTSQLAVAKGHYLNVLTTTQPGRMSALLSQGDAVSGSLNRWIFVFGTPKYRPSISNIKIDLTDAKVLLEDVFDWGAFPHQVRLDVDPETVKLWDELVQTEIRPLEASDNVLIARIELLCKKILLLFAINSMEEHVTPAHMRSLITLFPYLKKCYGIVEKNVGISQQEECTEAMRKYFASHPNDDITMRVLAKQSGARKFDTVIRKKAMETLVYGGEVIEAPRPKNVTAPKWRHNPDTPTPLAQVIPIR